MTVATDTSASRSTNRAGSVASALGIVMVGALALVSRFWQIGDKSIWLDEAWSWRAAKLSLSGMVDWTATDRHPPLYYAVLHFWVKVAGDSEAALRAPSAIAGAAAMVLVVAAAHQAGGRRLAAATAALLSLNAASVEFAQEARMYPLAGLLALSATLALAGFIRQPTLSRLVLYTTLTIGLVYTHYSGFVVLGVHACLFAGYGLERALRRRDARTLAGGVLALAGVGLAYIPWMANFRESAQGDVGHIPDPSVHVAAQVTRAALGLGRAEDAWPLLAVALLALGAWGLARRRRDPRVVALAALALVPVAQLGISILVKPVFDLRQVSPYIPAVAFMCAVGLVEAGEAVARARGAFTAAGTVALSAGAALLGATMLAGLLSWYRSGPVEDWRRVADDVRGVSGPAFIWRDYCTVPLVYYVDEQDVYPISSPAASGVDTALSTHTTNPAGGEAALVVCHAPDAEVRALLAAFAQRFALASPQRYDGGVFVYRLRPK